jgi:hypothetical protein
VAICIGRGAEYVGRSLCLFTVQFHIMLTGLSSDLQVGQTGLQERSPWLGVGDTGLV